MFLQLGQWKCTWLSFAWLTMQTPGFCIAGLKLNPALFEFLFLWLMTIIEVLLCVFEGTYN